MVEKVPQQDVNKYGIADINGAELSPGEQAGITQLVEKPSVEDAPSDLAVVGRYVFQLIYGRCWRKHRWVRAMKFS